MEHGHQLAPTPPMDAPKHQDSNTLAVQMSLTLPEQLPAKTKMPTEEVLEGLGNTELLPKRHSNRVTHTEVPVNLATAELVYISEEGGQLPP